MRCNWACQRYGMYQATFARLPRPSAGIALAPADHFWHGQASRGDEAKFSSRSDMLQRSGASRAGVVELWRWGALNNNVRVVLRDGFCYMIGLGTTRLKLPIIFKLRPPHLSTSSRPDLLRIQGNERQPPGGSLEESQGLID